MNENILDDIEVLAKLVTVAAPTEEEANEQTLDLLSKLKEVAVEGLDIKSINIYELRYSRAGREPRKSKPIQVYHPILHFSLNDKKFSLSYHIQQYALTFRLNDGPLRYIDNIIKDNSQLDLEEEKLQLAITRIIGLLG